jgi:hypothetical protein
MAAAVDGPKSAWMDELIEEVDRLKAEILCGRIGSLAEKERMLKERDQLRAENERQRQENTDLHNEVVTSNLQVDAARKALVSLFAVFVEVAKTSTESFNEWQVNAIALAKPFLDCPKHGYYAQYQLGEGPCLCPTTQANEHLKTGQQKDVEKQICHSINAGGIRCIREPNHCGAHMAHGCAGYDDLLWSDKS